MPPKTSHPNALIKETSPYLLQHAHNPVNWFPWSEEAWEKARKENKLVLVSIGYSACHWCHVMEHESFENESTAKLMNDHYVCIKVDREERPDVDQVYMTAVQLMTGSGGWPLNCFTLPDGKPIYGGTYFPNATWNDLLVKLHRFYKENPEQARQYAEELTQGIQQTEIIHPAEKVSDFSKDQLINMVAEWKRSFDSIEGGPNRAPKFPLPNNYEFLLRYSMLFKDESIANHVKLTLNKMAYGGIYDHVGGGFSRYSVDGLWKVPHFEKMLYDNAQLVSLYSNAFRRWKDPLYKNIISETLQWIDREMKSEDGGFYSALDADSEGEEGRFYTWTEEELKSNLEKLPGENSWDIFSEYFNVNATGLWEHGRYILLRKKTEEEIAKQFSITTEALQLLIANAKAILLNERATRIRPGLDDKIIASWNALMIKGYCDAYAALGEAKYLDAAIQGANFLLNKMSRPDGGFFHTYKNGKATINGFLDDYAFTIEAFLSLYESTFEEKWLSEARRITEYVIIHFQDTSSGSFFYTSNLDAALIARKKELSDNVIPASNSSLGKSLFYLGELFDEKKYSELSARMLSGVVNQMEKYGPGYSNWGILYMHHVMPFREIAICGNDSIKLMNELRKEFLPNTIFAGSMIAYSALPLLLNRFVSGKTLIYVCENKSCKLPMENISDAFELLKRV